MNKYNLEELKEKLEKRIYINEIEKIIAKGDENGL